VRMKDVAIKAYAGALNPSRIVAGEARFEYRHQHIIRARGCVCRMTVEARHGLTIDAWAGQVRAVVKKRRSIPAVG